MLRYQADKLTVIFPLIVIIKQLATFQLSVLMISHVGESNAGTIICADAANFHHLIAQPARD